MSQVFDAYARYYDLLYRDKDYDAEAAYVHGLVQRDAPGAKRLLELGCGTGAHALRLAHHGYELTGIDRSPEMVRQARARAATVGLGTQVSFDVGDLRSYRGDQVYDVVLALFHVISYQTSSADLVAAMATAATHLRPGGLFVFDCWYGPGVLHDPPVTRVKRLQGEGIRITRLAEPDHRVNDNCVDVHYEVLVERPDGLDRIVEKHAMRYLFTPEVDLLLESAGLQRIRHEHWLEGGELGSHTWNACFVARR